MSENEDFPVIIASNLLVSTDPRSNSDSLNVAKRVSVTLSGASAAAERRLYMELCISTKKNIVAGDCRRREQHAFLHSSLVWRFGLVVTRWP